MKAVTFREVIDRAPVNRYLTERGPVREIVCDEELGILFCCLPRMIVPYHIEREYWSPPVHLEGEFIDAKTVKGKAYILTTTGIYQLGFQ